MLETFFEMGLLTDVRTVGDEITILGSFSEVYKFPAAIEYLESRKVKVKGIINKTYEASSPVHGIRLTSFSFTIDQWTDCLDSIRTKKAIKAAIVFD